MKIDRRSFLAFGIAGAAGTALSPLPWKLMDDASIWSQMWPWTPVPPDGEVSFVNSTCTLCPGGCGITVRKVGERVVKIEGQKGHPVNDGGICLLGLCGPQLLYSPTRVKWPMRRKGERGEGKWERITWTEAVQILAEKLAAIRSQGKPQSVAAICDSDTGIVPSLLSRFLTVYGSPNFIRTPGMQDALEQTLYQTQGVRATAGYDVENADFILSFGAGILDGWGSPVRMFRANSIWTERKSRLVQIEPRLSNTAAKAWKWLAVKPGTEAALALGIAAAMIESSNYHQSFVEANWLEFEQWREKVTARYSPERVAKITGIDTKLIREVAAAFAQARRPIAIGGRGKGQRPGSLGEALAIHALNMLTGNINRKGGVQAIPVPEYIDWPQPVMDQLAAKGMQERRLDFAQSELYPNTRYLLNKFFENLTQGKGEPVQALLVLEANPVYSQPNSGRIAEVLKSGKIPFVATFSSYMDETVACADLVLPNHIYLERWQDIPQAAGFDKPIISLTRPVISPVLDTRHAGDTLIELAAQLGGQIAEAFPWSGYEDCLAATLGYRYGVMKQYGYWVDQYFNAAHMEFETASGQFELSAESVNELPLQGAEGLDGDAGIFDLVLIPFDSIRLWSAYIGDPPFAVKTVPDDVLKKNDGFVEINPETADKYNLKDGCRAFVETPWGKAAVRVNRSQGIQPGVIAMVRGLGHTAYDDYLAPKGVNINRLMGPMADPASGLDSAWGVRAKISKA